MIEKILKYLKNRQLMLCAVATVSKDLLPECAVLRYAVLDNLKVILSTHIKSRKIKNLEQNSKVALVFGWDNDDWNIQYEGKALIVKNGVEFEKCKKIYFSTHTDINEDKESKSRVFIIITPTWIRITDFTINPPLIEEKNY